MAEYNTEQTRIAIRTGTGTCRGTGTGRGMGRVFRSPAATAAPLPQHLPQSDRPRRPAVTAASRPQHLARSPVVPAVPRSRAGKVKGPRRAGDRPSRSALRTARNPHRLRCIRHRRSAAVVVEGKARIGPIAVGAAAGYNMQNRVAARPAPGRSRPRALPYPTRERHGRPTAGGEAGTFRVTVVFPGLISDKGSTPISHRRGRSGRERSCPAAVCTPTRAVPGDGPCGQPNREGGSDE